MNNHSLLFYQNNTHYYYFEIDELIKISQNIKKELEEYLHYEIDTKLQLDITSD